jgi:prepilin-type N-terminal cleavage/methylation domain-containing protein
MNTLKMKARSGVTLVELLVVILIVTILSVSMLPLLQPFVVESQYAAEAIPVIGNLRTKIGMYQYNKGTLPCIAANTFDNGKDTGKVTNPEVETWIAVDSASSTSAATDASKVDLFKASYAIFASQTTPPLAAQQVFDQSADPTAKNQHLSVLCDIDYQELKGKRSRPDHYQYLVMLNGSDYAYFVGCFGDNNGLKQGTGYAVCEIVGKGHKYVGTWSRYKPINNDNGESAQVCFTSSTEKPTNDTDLRHTFGCFVPDKSTIEAMDDQDGQLDIIGTMKTYGWEF